MRKFKTNIAENRIEFLRIAKEYFDTHGIELSPENGKQIPKETKVNSFGLAEGWSKDVYVLTETGIASAYYRGKDPQFTVIGLAIIDLYLKDVKMLSNKFLYTLDDFLPLVKHLKVN